VVCLANPPGDVFSWWRLRHVDRIWIFNWILGNQFHCPTSSWAIPIRSIRFEILIPSTTSQAVDEKPPSRNGVAEVRKRISDGHIGPTTCLRNVPALPTQIARLYVWEHTATHYRRRICSRSCCCMDGVVGRWYANSPPECLEVPLGHSGSSFPPFTCNLRKNDVTDSWSSRFLILFKFRLGRIQRLQYDSQAI